MCLFLDQGAGWIKTKTHETSTSEPMINGVEIVHVNAETLFCLEPIISYSNLNQKVSIGGQWLKLFSLVSFFFLNSIQNSYIYL